jgi:hypothetical protein
LTNEGFKTNWIPTTPNVA